MRTRAIAFVVVLAAGCFPPSNAPQGYDTIEVMVAKQTIPKDYKVDETMVTFRSIPKNFVQPKALRKVDELIGQISGTTIFEGTQITSTMLLSIEDAGLAFKIPKGYRSLTVPIEGPLGHVRPGNYVDILFLRPAENGKGTESATLLQNVYVLAVGDDLGQAVPVNLSGGGIDAPRASPEELAGEPTMSFMLTPGEVQVVALAHETGRLRVSLRSLWEGNTQMPLGKDTLPLPMRTPDPVAAREP